MDKSTVLEREDYHGGVVENANKLLASMINYASARGHSVCYNIVVVVVERINSCSLREI